MSDCISPSYYSLFSNLLEQWGVQCLAQGHFSTWVGTKPENFRSEVDCFTLYTTVIPWVKKKIKNPEWPNSSLPKLSPLRMPMSLSIKLSIFSALSQLLGESKED